MLGNHFEFTMPAYRLTCQASASREERTRAFAAHSRATPVPRSMPLPTPSHITSQLFVGMRLVYSNRRIYLHVGHCNGKDFNIVLQFM